MNYLILVDNLNPIPDNLAPQLEEVQNARLEKKTAEQCRAMLEAAMNDRIEIKVLSGYRTVEYQQNLWRRDMSQYIGEGLDMDTAERLTARYLARPGHSEHHTGLAIDFCSPDWDDTQDDFCSTVQGRWLCRNAADYGFILRYPRMKEHITGIAYEPWHYRYVGEEHAKIIKSEGLTLEEYLYYYAK